MPVDQNPHQTVTHFGCVGFSHILSATAALFLAFHALVYRLGCQFLSLLSQYTLLHFTHFGDGKTIIRCSLEGSVLAY